MSSDEELDNFLNYNNIAKFEIERRNADPEQKKEIEFIIFYFAKVHHA